MMILSEAELEELTGYKRAGEQTTWMQQNGFVFRVGGDGKLKELLELAMACNHALSIRLRGRGVKAQ